MWNAKAVCLEKLRKRVCSVQGQNVWNSKEPGTGKMEPKTHGAGLSFFLLNKLSLKQTQK